MSSEEFFYDSDLTDDIDEEFDFEDFEDTSSLIKVPSYDILDPEKLQTMADDVVDRTVEILGLDSRVYATILLRHFSWNCEQVINSYTENPDLLLKKAGIFIDKEKTKPKKFTCNICLDDYTKKSQGFALGCNHRYCNNCWSYYLLGQIKDGPGCVGATCPYPKCNAVVYEKVFKKFVDREAYAKYKMFLRKSIVYNNPFMKYCPAPNCAHIVKCDRMNRKEAVTCLCGFSFCFRCSDYEVGDHMPATCDQVQMWIERSRSESENIKWLIANTKRCPQCRKPIEKDGGCMSMVCCKKSGGCGHNFCWLCRDPWSEHGSETGGYYSCNKYNESSAKKEDLKSDEVKTELEEYLFYFHRHESHRNAMKVADEQRDKSAQRANEVMTKYLLRLQDVLFIKDATEQLLQNRKVLQWSYVYGYYLKSAEKELFEYLQQDIERHTDKLSEIYEQKLEEASYDEFMKWKSNVINQTKVTDNFLKKFVEAGLNGMI